MIWTTFEQAPVAATTGEDTPADGTRRITGTAVPWNQTGRVSDGSLVRFLPGSLDAAARPVLVNGHDASRAVGRVLDATDDPAGMTATATVSRTRDGDDVLTLAADGVLSMFSVGVNPTEWDLEDTPEGPVLVVAAGDWQHLAIVPYGAFPDALISDVAASTPTTLETPMSETLTTDTPTDLEAAPAVPVEAAAPRPAVIPLTTAAAPAPDLGLSTIAGIVAEGNREGLRAHDIEARINAALTNLTTTSFPSVPTYRTELVGLIDHGTPTVSRLDNRPLPATGMEILYPKWVLFPDDTTKQTTEKTEIGSGTASWAWTSVPVETWAQGNDLSLQVVQRSSPSAMDAYLRAAAVDAARKWDVAVITKLLAAATVATPGASFLANVAALYAALNPATCPPGNLFLGISPDVAATLIPIKATDGPAFWSGSINLGTFLPDATAGGLDVFVDPNLPAKTHLMGVGTGAATYGGSTLTDIRVVDVSLLGVDVGVYFNAACAVEYPGAFSKLTLP